VCRRLHIYIYIYIYINACINDCPPHHVSNKAYIDHFLELLQSCHKGCVLHNAASVVEEFRNGKNKVVNVINELSGRLYSFLVI